MGKCIALCLVFLGGIQRVEALQFTVDALQDSFSCDTGSRRSHNDAGRCLHRQRLLWHKDFPQPLKNLAVVLQTACLTPSFGPSMFNLTRDIKYVKEICGAKNFLAKSICLILQN